MGKRQYQYGFSGLGTAMHDVQGREQKARTMIAVLRDHFGDALPTLRVLDVGGSTGIIDNHLARHVAFVEGIDIDTQAVDKATQVHQRDNLRFALGDAMALGFPDASFDVVICSQVYEHVPDASRMMAEILRVLRPGGVCYFAANNRLMWNEPHYDLPLLSVVPRWLAHRYVRWSGKGTHYHELHFTKWGLQRLVRGFEVIDYTRKIIEDPVRYEAAYMLPPGSRKQRIARLVARWAHWMVPGYIWLLRKAR